MKKYDFPVEWFDGVAYHEGFGEARKRIMEEDSIEEMLKDMEPLLGVPEDLDTEDIEAVRVELMRQVEDDFRVGTMLTDEEAARIICKHHPNYECAEDEDGKLHVYTLERMD